MTPDSGDVSLRQPPWVGMELRHLAALDALARGGSFRGAAHRLGVVQSAVSQQIAHCERVVGMPLVERRRGQRTAQLTGAGKELAAHARSILAQLDAARADLAPFAGGDAQRLRIAVAPSLGSAVGLRLEKTIRQLEPRLRVATVEPALESELVSLASRGEVNLAFGECGARPGHLASLTLFPDPYLLVVQSSSPMAQEGFADLADLHRLTLLAPSASQGLAHAERHLAGHEIGVSGIAQAVGVATIQALVAHGIGAAVLPSRAVETRDHRIVAFPLDAVLPPRPIGLVWHSGRLRTGPIELVCRAAMTIGAEPKAIPQTTRQVELPAA